MALFQGLSAFPLTPADEGGRVDTDALRVLLARLVEARVGSIGLLGSTGTSPYLTRAERRRAVEAAVDQAAGQVPGMVGIGALRTDEAVRLGQDAKGAGADAVLLAPVSYAPLTEEEVFTHFATVAEAVGLPLCIYNNPGTTHFTFGDELIARLSRVPQVYAVKNPAPDASALPGSLRALRVAAAPGFSVGYSVDGKAAEAMLAGKAAVLFKAEQYMGRLAPVCDEYRTLGGGFFSSAGVLVELSAGQGGDRHGSPPGGRPYVAMLLHLRS